MCALRKTTGFEDPRVEGIQRDPVWPVGNQGPGTRGPAPDGWDQIPERIARPRSASLPVDSLLILYSLQGGIK